MHRWGGFLSKGCCFGNLLITFTLRRVPRKSSSARVSKKPQVGMESHWPGSKLSAHSLEFSLIHFLASGPEGYMACPWSASFWSFPEKAAGANDKNSPSLVWRWELQAAKCCLPPISLRSGPWRCNGKINSHWSLRMGWKNHFWHFLSCHISRESNEVSCEARCLVFVDLLVTPNFPLSHCWGSASLALSMLHAHRKIISKTEKAQKFSACFIVFFLSWGSW